MCLCPSPGLSRVTILAPNEIKIDILHQGMNPKHLNSCIKMMCSGQECETLQVQDQSGQKWLLADLHVSSLVWFISATVFIFSFFLRSSIFPAWTHCSLVLFQIVWLQIAGCECCSPNTQPKAFSAWIDVYWRYIKMAQMCFPLNGQKFFIGTAIQVSDKCCDDRWGLMRSGWIAFIFMFDYNVSTDAHSVRLGHQSSHFLSEN